MVAICPLFKPSGRLLFAPLLCSWLLWGGAGTAAETQMDNRPGWKQLDGEESAGRKRKTFAQLVSDNSQPVGLLGHAVKATLVAYKTTAKASARPQGHLEFSANVLANAYNRKGCQASACVMEVRFDGQLPEKFRLFEARPEVYLKRVMIFDEDFFKKAFKARTMTIKLRFEDSVEGVFSFRNSASFGWKEQE